MFMVTDRIKTQKKLKFILYIQSFLGGAEGVPTSYENIQEGGDLTSLVFDHAP